MNKLLSYFPVSLHLLAFYDQQISRVAGLGIVALILAWLSAHGGDLAGNTLLDMATTGAWILFSGYGVWVVSRFVWEASWSSRLPAQFLVLAGFFLFGMAIYWNWFELAISGYLLCLSAWASFKAYTLNESDEDSRRAAEKAKWARREQIDQMCHLYISHLLPELFDLQNEGYSHAQIAGFLNEVNYCDVYWSSADVRVYYALALERQKGTAYSRLMKKAEGFKMLQAQGA